MFMVSERFHRFFRNAGDAEVNIRIVLLQGQTGPLYHNVRDDDFLALCAVPPLFQVSLSCRDLGRVVLPLTQVSPVYRKNLVLLATHQQQPLELRVSPNCLDWFWGIGLAWKNRDELFLQVTVERVSQLVDVQLYSPNYRPFLSNRDHFSKEIFGGRRGDKYCLLYNGSPPFNLSAFTMQLGGRTP